ncbi:hypothetical protein MPSEU_000930700 [Mayamaea pseudoterrestris]|nr:hypothetical protein MPSEU_000930700 [Mayamaea pseudoterrestris]
MMVLETLFVTTARTKRRVRESSCSINLAKQTATFRLTSYAALHLTITVLLAARRAYAFVLSSTLKDSRNLSAEITRLFSTTTSAPTVTVTLSHTDFNAAAASTPSSSQEQDEVPPVIFLHGLLGSKRNFASIGTSLAKQQQPSRQHRRILGVDLRNHGETSKQPCSSMNYQDMAGDVLEFMNQQSIPRAVLIGHSMGGKVGQACALLEPKRVDGLVVLDIAPVSYSSEDAHWKAVQDIIQTMCQVQVGPGVTKAQVDLQLRNAVPDPALRAFVLTNLEQRKGGECQWKIPIETIADQLEQLAAFDVPTSHQYHGDVFFIHGGQSRFVKSSYLGRIGEYFPNHLLTTIRGAGHWIHAEAPDDTTALLKRYLNR